LTAVRRLVVTEKNHAAMRIASILSEGKMRRSYPRKVAVFEFDRGEDQWTVVGLRGHVLNLDYTDEFNRWESTELKKLIWAEPIKEVTAHNIVETLKELAAKTDEVIIATDYDREGELIGVEALEIMRPVSPHKTVRRAKFSALTKTDIDRAFENLVEVDYALAESAETRQVVDLAWGATLTRFMSLAANQLGHDFLSVGRVQTPTLALVVDREKEIENFVPQDYWSLFAQLKKGEEFRAAHEKNPFWRKDEAEAARARACLAVDGKVISYEEQEKEERPPVPFSTTIFITEANRIGFSAAQAMKIAENLYQDGYISYPRTDNTVYPPTLNLRGVLNKLKASVFSDAATEILAQPSIRPTRGKTETTDHPPIYPVDAAKKTGMRSDYWRIYELVVSRFLATLAPNAVAVHQEARIDVNEEVFTAQGYRVKSPGWRKYYSYYDREEKTIPKMSQGDSVEIVKMHDLEHNKTKPPPRHTQGSIIQEMERKGLGTKSTRHEIIQKLFERNYVEGRFLKPTSTGRAMVLALETHARKITEPEMTAHLESDMDEVARSVRTEKDVVTESQEMLADVLDVMDTHRDAIGKSIKVAMQEQNVVGKCPKDGGDLYIAKTNRGGRYLTCTNYAQCRTYNSVPQTGELEETGEHCPECKSILIQHVDGHRITKMCVNSECPTVVKRRHIGVCPKDGGNLTLRYSGRGKRFVGCSNYPKCNQTYPLPQKGPIHVTGRKCEHCGSPIIETTFRGKGTWVLCINMECPGKAKNNKAKPPEKKAKRERKPKAVKARS
jgi:DNA topoisomerase-1